MEFIEGSPSRFDRKHGIRWDRITRLVSSRGSVRREGKTAELIDHSLREAFPGTIIKTHPQPRKK